MTGSPVRVEHAVALAQITDLHPEVAPDKQPVRRLPEHGVPQHSPPHEIAVTGGLVVRTLAEHREGDVARVQV